MIRLTDWEFEKFNYELLLQFLKQPENFYYKWKKIPEQNPYRTMLISWLIKG